MTLNISSRRTNLNLGVTKEEETRILDTVLVKPTVVKNEEPSPSVEKPINSVVTMPSEEHEQLVKEKIKNAVDKLDSDKKNTEKTKKQKNTIESVAGDELVNLRVKKSILRRLLILSTTEDVFLVNKVESYLLKGLEKDEPKFGIKHEPTV